MPLNQAQALSLATTLRMLEERCDQIERLLAELIALVQVMQSLLSENTTNGRVVDVTR